MSVDLGKVAGRLVSRKGRTESEIQADIRTLLLDGDLNLQDTDLTDVNLEAPVGGGRRIDVEIGYTVIEVKKSDLSTNAALKEKATAQLAGYVATRVLETGQRYVGILTDGANWYLFNLLPEGSLREVSSFSLRSPDDIGDLVDWLEGVLATRQQIKPSPSEIEHRLGYQSSSFKLDIADLTTLYETCRDEPEVKLKRALWARLLTTALGTNFEDTDELFIRHTYMTITAEVLAHIVAGFDVSASVASGNALLSGEEFSRAKIFGVVEADFFDWPTETPAGDPLVRSIARRLSRFDWSSVEHDILKVLYESVIDAETRHSLGEYYTPDWLAERMIDELVSDPLGQRVLDPSCGSGTFVFWAVRKYLKAADAAGVDNADALAGVTNHVFGIDVHPVAVTLARVTYLLAIGLDRLQDRGELSIPVYLGDSVQWEQDDSLLSGGGVLIHAGGSQLFTKELFFPERVVANASAFDRLVNDLMDKATSRNRGSPVPSVGPILSRYGVHPADRAAVEETFAVLCELHDTRDDHIWGYYIRNRARPLWFTLPANRAHVVIGNPPWLSYRFMPDEMQQKFQQLSRDRNLWAGAKVAPHQDLSALFWARSVELYLKPEGHIGFVMPAATLSRQQYTGFRKGDYSTKEALTNVSFETPWDLTDIEPSIFPVPAGIVFARQSDVTVPLPATAEAWHGTLPKHDIDWEDARSHLTRSSVTLADTSAEPTSEYHALFTQGATVVPRMLLVVEHAEVGPLGAPAGVEVVRSRRTNLEKEPWKSLPTQEGAIESRFIRSLHLGETILPYRHRKPLHAVIPWDGKNLLVGSDPDLDMYPGLAAWWRQAENLWEDNKTSGSTMYLRDRLDYQRTMSKQFPIAEHRVVYTKSGTKLAATRIDDTTTVIDHKLYWAPVGSTEEGRYLCAILNSQTLLDVIKHLQGKGQFGARDFDKYVFHAPFPLYNPDVTLHRELAEAAAHAETVAASVDVDSFGFQKARRLVREALVADGIAGTIDRLVGELIT